MLGFCGAKISLCKGIHGVKLSAYARLTFVLQQPLPLTTLFLPLLDRLCLSFVTFVKPGIQPRVGFHLLILLSVVLVYWRRRRESNPPKSDRQSGALPRGLQRHVGIAYGDRTRLARLKA